jgi:Ion channel
MNGALHLYLMGLRRRWRDPLLTALTVLLALMLFVIAPLQAAGAIRSEGIGFALIAVAAAALLVVSGSLLPVLWTLLAVALSVLAAVLRVAHSGLALYSDAAAWVILGISTGWVVARAVFGPGRVNYHRILGAILLYLLIGATFVALYTFIGLVFPGAFSGIRFEDGPALASNLIYFSFVTLTSTGFGDIVPLHPLARSLCNVEGIIGQLFPATLLARLVSLGLVNTRGAS